VQPERDAPIPEDSIEWVEPRLEELVSERLGIPVGSITQGDLTHIWGIELFGDSHIFINADGGYSMYVSESEDDYVYGNHVTILNPSDIDIHWGFLENIDFGDCPKEGVYSVGAEMYMRGNISSLADFANFKNLRYLHIHKNSLIDLSGLSSLEHLVEVKLLECNIEDVVDLSGLTQIEALNLTANRIRDISPLSGLRQLKRVLLWANDIRKIDAMASMNDLAHFNISNNPVSCMDALSGKRKLEYLYISNTYVEDFSFLSGKPDLRSIYMTNLKVDAIDLSPFATAGLDSLNIIHAFQNRAEIVNYQALQYLTHRVSLTITPGINITEEVIAWLEENLPRNGYPSFVF